MIAIVKARKQRNAVVLTIPAKFGVEVGQSFFIIQEDGGSFRLIPETEDFFQNPEKFNIAHDLSEYNGKHTP